MLADHAKVVVDSVALGLAGLRGEIADVELQRRRSLDGLHHSLHQEIGQDRGVERARAHDDELGVEDGLRGFRVDLHAVGLEEDVADRPVLLGNLGFALDGAAVDRGDKSYVLQRGRHYGSLDRQDLARFAQSLLEVAGDVGHRHDEKVSERVTVE